MATFRWTRCVPAEVVEFVARQVQVPASDLDSYLWTGRTIEYHRAQIRKHLGFRECSVDDAEKLTAWVAEHVACRERRCDQVLAELMVRCRAECIEPPTPRRCDPIVFGGAAPGRGGADVADLLSAQLQAGGVPRVQWTANPRRSPAHNARPSHLGARTA